MASEGSEHQRVDVDRFLVDLGRAADHYEAVYKQLRGAAPFFVSFEAMENHFKRLSEPQRIREDGQMLDLGEASYRQEVEALADQAREWEGSLGAFIAAHPMAQDMGLVDRPSNRYWKSARLKTITRPTFVRSAIAAEREAAQLLLDVTGADDVEDALKLAQSEAGMLDIVTLAKRTLDVEPSDRTMIRTLTNNPSLHTELRDAADSLDRLRRLLGRHYASRRSDSRDHAAGLHQRARLVFAAWRDALSRPRDRFSLENRQAVRDAQREVDALLQQLGYPKPFDYEERRKMIEEALQDEQDELWQLSLAKKSIQQLQDLTGEPDPLTAYKKARMTLKANEPYQPTTPDPFRPIIYSGGLPGLGKRR